MNRKFKRITIILLSSLFVLTGIVNADLTFAEEVILDNENNELIVDNDNNTEETTNENDSLLFEGDVLTQNENGQWEVNPTASKDNPLTQEQLLENLPKNIIIKKDGEETIVPITYDFSKYGESQYKGEHIVVAIIPEGTELPEGYEYHIDVLIKFAEVETVIDGAILERHMVDTVSPKGTTINLFDYTDSGINTGHQLKFNGGGGEGINGNSWTGYLTRSDISNDSNTDHYNGRYQFSNIVKDRLENGYPVIRQYGVDKRFSSTGFTQEESLDYLFSTTPHDGKIIYPNVKGLLQVDGDGYYLYDAQDYYASFNKEENTFNVYDTGGIKTNDSKHSSDGQFFPFEEIDNIFTGEDSDGNLIQSNRTCADGGNNHHFGVTMQTRFIQQKGGYIDGDTTKPVTYEFTGDDDVWVFIDGVLVADIGGIHDAVSTTINFATGVVTVGADSTTLNEIFGWADNKVTFEDDTYHTLNFFYLERGRGASNMKLKYNLVTVPETDLQKVDQSGESVPGAEFELYEAEPTLNGSSYNRVQLLATGQTDADGMFIFTDENQHILSLKDLYDKEIKYLILRETKVPAGYRKTGEDAVLELVGPTDETKNVGAFLISKNIWESGVFASAKVSSTLPDTITKFGDNNPIEYKNNGIVFAVVMKKINSGPIEDVKSWAPVTGNQVTGWNIGEDGTWDSIIKAAKASKYQFDLSSDGSYKVEIADLPGDIQNYYYMLDDKDQATETQWSVGYYYTEADNWDDANAGNTYRIDDSEIDREFAARLYVPNIANHLMVQKVDENGEAIANANAVFEIYKESDVELIDGIYQLSDDAIPYDTQTTRDFSKEAGSKISINSTAVFPSSEVTSSQNRAINPNLALVTGETYFIKEVQAPDGYKVNDKLIKVDITHEGIFADAGDADDGISVQLGVGSVVKSLYQFVNGSADRTLSDIVATMKTGTFSKDNGGFKETNDNKSEIVHLTYNEAAAILEYMPTDHADDSPYPDAFEVDAGYSTFEIKQWYDDTTNKMRIGDLNIYNLFAESVLVKVENQKKSLIIEKDLVDEVNSHQNDKEETFTYKITLQDNQEQMLSGTYNAEYYDADNKATTGTVEFTNGVGEVTLTVTEKDVNNPSVVIVGLPVGTKYTIEESQVLGFESSYKVNNATDFKIGYKVEGTINENIETVLYQNTYKVVDFSFKKVRNDSTGLSGAKFVLYRLNCSDTTHTETDHSGLITENGIDPCWTKVERTYTSSDDTDELGLVEISDLLPAGEYRLVETKAPDDYVTPTGQWKLIYNAEKQIYEFGESVGHPPAAKITDDGYLLYNYKPNELPLTGYTGTMIFLVSGISLMLIGGVIIVLRNKRRVDKL